MQLELGGDEPSLAWSTYLKKQESVTVWVSIFEIFIYLLNGAYNAGLTTNYF